MDSFFGMPREDAVNVLYIYKQRIQQFEGLTYFHNACRAILSSSRTHFPSLPMKPSESLLAKMENHINKCSGETANTRDKDQQDSGTKQDNGTSSCEWEETWDCSGGISKTADEVEPDNGSSSRDWKEPWD